MHARFDKHGKQLPDTGRGCGCRMCEESGAPQYERRGEARADGDAAWGPLRRRFARLAKGLRPPQVAGS
jgi:hypothetical protein